MRSYRLTYLVLLLTFAMGTSPAPAATFVVNSSADRHDSLPGDGQAVDASGETTLRAAIEETNAVSGPDTVIVPESVSPIRLVLGELRIEDDHLRLTGVDNPIIDGVLNILNSDLLVLAADSGIIEGLTLRRSRRHALLITGSDNRIGGENEGHGLLLTANGLDNANAAAIVIEGPDASGNTVVGCYIGMYGNGTLVDGNRIGVLLDREAHHNTIGGNNLISGNDLYGVMITGGAHSNQITRNTIGPEVEGDSGPGNGLGGILLTDGVHANIIGGDSLLEGNLISANGGPGLELRGTDVSANIINGNFIGTDITGLRALSNSGDGILITDGSHNNLIGGSSPFSGNLISGNHGSGVHLTGASTSDNTLLANIIGLDIRGYLPVSNGTVEGDGVLIDSGSHNNYVGGQGKFEANIVSGNVRSGIHIDGSGSNDNIVAGNIIGLTGLGTSSAFNGSGVVISGGAKKNIIGGSTLSDRNYISGNRADLFPGGAGVLIRNSGTDYNRVSGNYIGLDVAGSRALRNGGAGVVIGDGAQFNIIGGEQSTERNVISGNGATDPLPGHASGVHLYGKGTSYNLVIGNDIGWSAERLSIIPNAGHGIGLYAGASDNQIGGNSPDSGNAIVGNELHGIYLSDVETRGNLIRHNVIKQNDSLGIAIRNLAQGGIQPPVLDAVPLWYPWDISGSGAPPGGTVDIYLAPSPSAGGEALQLLFSVSADSAGEFSFSSFDPIDGTEITAIATDSNQNSSALALSVTVGTTTAVDDDTDFLPWTFALEQNYPNPFNPETNIRFSLARASDVNLSIFNTLGRRVATLIDENLSAGGHLTRWNGTDNSGRTVASGLYFYRLNTADYTSSRKMLLIK